MKRKVVAIFCTVVMLSVLLAACGSGAAEESRVELTKKGEIVEYTVEDFSGPNYDADEFKNFVKDSIAEYEETGSGKIKVSHESFENDTAYLTLTYDVPDTYYAFNGLACFSGTLQEARLAGYDFSVDFLEADTRRVVSASEFSSDESLQVFIIETDVEVQIPGVVKYYYSSYGSAVNLGEDAVQLAVPDDLIGVKNIVYVIYSEE